MTRRRKVIWAAMAVALAASLFLAFGYWRDILRLTGLQRSCPLIFREMDQQEMLSLLKDNGSQLFESSIQRDHMWMLRVLTNARVRGWAWESLARKLEKEDAKVIDALLLPVIASDDAVYLPAALDVLTIMGGRLEKSVGEFQGFLERRFVGGISMHESYSGQLFISVVAAVSRLAADGDPWARECLMAMRSTKVIGKVSPAHDRSVIMFEAICSFSTFCPDQTAVTFLESVVGKYSYAQRRIDLIKAYQASKDRYQDYVFELIERSPGSNKYIPEYEPPVTGPPIPPVRARIQKIDVEPR